ncbi:MAG: hypothetical protein SOI62_06325 [Lactobacillus sp.]
MAKRRAGSQSASGAADFSERATPEAGLPPEVVNGASCLAVFLVVPVAEN